MSDRSATIIEAFSSIQGEGLLVGVRQVFLRFAGCNLACNYCDTATGNDPTHAMLEATPGRRDFIPVDNPLPLDRLVQLLDGWSTGWPAIHHSLSVTGGEPLLQHQTLLEWLPRLRELLPIYLETNGALPNALFGLLHHIDYISMDIKIPSTSGCHNLWETHRAFIRASVEKQLFVKTVIGESTEDWEITKTCNVISSVSAEIPLVLQPVTTPDGSLGATSLKMLQLQEIACRSLKNVRIIPQTHRFSGLL